MPMMMPPRSWLAAVRALITVPTSNTPSQREIRTSMVSGSTRTSQNCAPVAARTHRRRSRTIRAAKPSMPDLCAASTWSRPAAVRISAYVWPPPEW